MITKQGIEEILQTLSKTRKVFWSEADFQHAFAWELQAKYNQAKIYLERRYEPSNEADIVYYIDIWVELDGKCYPIELKYKTAELKISPNSAQIGLSKTTKLKAQGAQDTGRYDFLKDIQRIENIKSHENNVFGNGFAIILTNDFHYYKNPNNKLNTEVKTLDRQFRIHEGCLDKTGELQWVNKKGKFFSYQNDDEQNHWTKNYPPLRLKGTYKMIWNQYSEIVADDATKDENIFKYCVCEISKP